jgi:hypothetical protein
MDARYVKAVAVLPHQNKVCGRTLRPFCLRHRMMLEAIGSPFLAPETSEFSAEDVVNATKILSTYDKEEASSSYTLRDRIEVAFMRRNKKRLLRNIGRVLGIINVSCSYPKFWSKKDAKKSRVSYERVPWVLSCVANLCRNGVDLESAWTMPEGEAVWMSISSAIYNGSDIDILSTDEEKELEKFNERIEKYKKQMNHKN